MYLLTNVVGLSCRSKHPDLSKVDGRRWWTRKQEGNLHKTFEKHQLYTCSNKMMNCSLQDHDTLIHTSVRLNAIFNPMKRFLNLYIDGVEPLNQQVEFSLHAIYFHVSHWNTLPYGIDRSCFEWFTTICSILPHV